MPSLKKSLFWLLIVSAAVLAGAPLSAAEFPTKPVTLVIPYPAGGSTDLTGRALAVAAKQYLGQPVICENKSGGGGTVGPSLVLSKPPDGYTIGISSGAVTIAYHMGKLNFNPLEDSTPIIRYTSYVFGMVVRSDSPWKTIQEFVKYAKENPNKVTYGTPGVGTNPHLAMEELSILTGIQLVHMPFKGGAEANTALLGGHIDAISDSTSWGPMVDAGKFRLLVTYSPAADAQVPDGAHVEGGRVRHGVHLAHVHDRPQGHPQTDRGQAARFLKKIPDRRRLPVHSEEVRHDAKTTWARKTWTGPYGRNRNRSGGLSRSSGWTRSNGLRTHQIP